MTNHDRFANVMNNYTGQTLTMQEIEHIMLQQSDIKRGSILPNDHAEGNVGSCHCAKNRSNTPLFDRVGRGLYFVR
jgi:hypothetical protein